LVALCTGLLLAGCGGGPTVLPVAGTATVDGEPLAGFSVHYIPDAEKGHTIEMDCSSRIDKDGRYAIFTDDRYKQYDGCPPGWYKVTIGSPNDVPIPINAKFLDIKKEALSIEVRDDAPPGAYDLKFTK
jgi:hypothetical protein